MSKRPAKIVATTKPLPWPQRYADLEALYAASRQETERFRDDNLEVGKRFGEMRDNRDAERAKRAEAEAEVKELRERLDELKAKYADCRFQNATMNGYLDRVYEDDVVREPTIEVADFDQNPVLKRTQPKRPPRQQFLDIERHGRPTFHSGEWSPANPAGKSRRPDHWAKY